MVCAEHVEEDEHGRPLSPGLAHGLIVTDEQFVPISNRLDHHVDAQ